MLWRAIADQYIGPARVRVHTMNDINEISQIQPPLAPRNVEAADSISSAAGAEGPLEVSDVVEISEAARLAAEVQSIPEVRTELIERVRAEIASGDYETPARLEVAVTRLLDDLMPML